MLNPNNPEKSIVGLKKSYKWGNSDLKYSMNHSVRGMRKAPYIAANSSFNARQPLFDKKAYLTSELTLKTCSGLPYLLPGLKTTLKSHNYSFTTIG